MGLLGRKLTIINGSSRAAVGLTETMVPGLPGQRVNGNSAAAVDPIDTCMVMSNVIRSEDGSKDSNNMLDALRNCARRSDTLDA